MSVERPIWIAFLRGMNLGNRRLSNEELVGAFARGGFPGAEAYQASGNVVFRDERSRDVLVATLEEGLEHELGFAVPVFLRSADEVRDLAESAPFSEEEFAASRGKRHVVLLRRTPPTEVIDEIMEIVPPGDVLVPAGRELHWLPGAGLSDSDMDLRRIDRLTGGTTIRTHGTLRRLSARFGG